LPVRACSSFFSFSTSAPFRPMMMPGRAVKMVIRARFADRSISILAMPAC
jgi:hypothetical protein